MQTCQTFGPARATSEWPLLVRARTFKNQAEVQESPTNEYLTTAPTALWALWDNTRRCSALNFFGSFRSKSALASHAVSVTTTSKVRLRHRLPEAPIHLPTIFQRHLVLPDAATSITPITCPLTAPRPSSLPLCVIPCGPRVGLMRSRDRGLISNYKVGKRIELDISQVGRRSRHRYLP